MCIQIVREYTPIKIYCFRYIYIRDFSREGGRDKQIFPGREEGTNRFFHGGRERQTDFSREGEREKQIFPGREGWKNRFFQGGREGQIDFSSEVGRDKQIFPGRGVGKNRY